MALKAVFFDIGGTIDTFCYTRELRIDNAGLVRNCLRQAGIDLPMDDAQIADSITGGAAAYVKWNMETNIELKPAEIWSRYFLKDATIPAARLEPVGEELAFLYETRLYTRVLRPEAPAVLEAIRALGLKIGCISNTQSLRQVPYNLAEYGISQYFDPVVLSSSYGRRKPDPAIFYYAARLGGVPTGACMYVGDRINRDILGAQRAGFRATVQIVHPYDSGETDEGAVPDAVITNLADLLPIIAAELEKDRRLGEPRSGRRVKAVFFDAGDILYHRPHRDRHLKHFLQAKTLNPRPDFETEKHRLREQAYAGKLPRRKYYEQVIQLYGLVSPEDIASGAQAMRADDNTVEIFDGAAETIRELKARGFILGIITDTALPTSKKLGWFDRDGFGRLWDIVISSKEMGVRKPAPCMYEEALAQASVRPDQAVFVGHKPSELDGARAVGMHTIALNYEPGSQADLYIDDIRSLTSAALFEE